ncbi:metal-dependent hydrolase [Geodermatophilus africanus]|nr:metal-dependent hydrolase [Geodermatophilus africanus]
MFRTRPCAWLLPPVVAVAIALIDVVLRSRLWPLPVVGLLDGPAHLATAWLALRALAPRSTPPWLWATALAASVVIDVDHVPMYLSDGGFTVNGGRPPTHSLALAVLLVAIGLAGRATRWALGAAIGVLLHFVRDVATGPGLPLLWPASHTAILAPYQAYLIAVAVLALVAAYRSRPRTEMQPVQASSLQTSESRPQTSDQGRPPP